jgi:hypothetical protein
MTDDHDSIPQILTERIERRLSEESGRTRTEMATGFGQLRTEMATGLGQIRTEMADRNAELLKWALIFFTTQLTGTAALLALFR